MGILKDMFKIPPLPLYNVVNQQHCLTQVLLIIRQHCSEGEGERNTNLSK